MNENYPLAGDHDPDFDKPHGYAKSNGDGSIRHHCRCERRIDDPIHEWSPVKIRNGKKEEAKTK